MSLHDPRYYTFDECLRVQMDGFSACKECPLAGKPECGGQKIVETKKNRKGYTIKEHGLDPDSHSRYDTPKPDKKAKKKKK